MKRYSIKRKDDDEMSPVGRPSGYKKEYAEMALVLCRMGATDNELAEAFQVTTSTIWYWSSHFPSFSSAIKEGKDAFDERVKRAMAQRAIGYTFDTEEIHVTKRGRVIRIPIKKHIPPDVTACIFWLKNRDRENWRDVWRLEQTGANGGPIEVHAVKERLQKKLEAIGKRMTRESGNGKDSVH